MTVEATIRSYADAFNRSDVPGMAAHYAATTDYRQPFLPGALTTPADVEAFESGMFASFSAVKVAVEWLVANGDEGAAGIEVVATHTADMPMPDGTVLPATGVTIELHTAEFVRVDGSGKIVEHRRYLDAASMMAQLTGAHA
jgi:predicted ester cyclase